MIRSYFSARYLAIGLTMAVVLLLGSLAPVAFAQSSPSLEWERYDNRVRIQSDGSVQVSEVQTLDILSGTVRRMTRTFETGSFGRATDFAVSEDGQPYQQSQSGAPGTFTARDNGSEAEIVLYFRDPGDTEHDLSIDYVLERSLIEGDNTATMGWEFFWDDGAPPIRQGSVSITLPEAVPQSQLEIATDGPAVSSSYGGDTVSLELRGEIQGEQLGVDLTFPKQVLAGSAVFRSGGTSAPVTGGQQPSGSGAQQPAGGIDPFCFVLLGLLLLVGFFMIVSAARRRGGPGGYSEVPAYGPDDDQYGPAPWPQTYYSGRRRRRYGQSWGMPPIIVVPGSRPRDHNDSPGTGLGDWFGGGQNSGGGSDDDSSGGGLGGWFGGGSGGGFSSWGSSGGGSRSWGSSGGGSRSWGGGGGGGGGGSRGGGGGGGFG